jgi:hypothetical protein
MHLELYDWTAENVFKRTVLHEFGHVLGCLHEHQNPSAGIKWNKPAVYEYYLKLGWVKADVDENVFESYDCDLTQFSEFDRHSIMLYAIPSRFTTNGFSVDWNDDLSEMDKEFIARAYPKHP